ncbi:MAG TPA: thioredoxin domain-containing protein [Acidimicrobiia bacterium]|nr:thioredoxin domain-containing protein [Acidimicrobiia bacterium]
MNRLTDETSPYLRQHADNPVDWYPWGDDAFARARAEDKPILLSVGYSSCHWCHVMAHESFEDPDVAGVMNRLFVNVKVDREERPDVDAVYMGAVQALTGQGGWPMTVFLTPGGEAFHGGTYFPRRSGHGRPGFVELLEAVDDAWRNRRGDLLDQATNLTGALRRASPADSPDPAADLPAEADADLPRDLAARAVDALAAEFDARFGGFGRAPKFPHAMTLDFLVQRAVTHATPEIIEMVTTSLDAMAAGGLYDQVGGGFHRYSVDAFWQVPHFEKMLYDQALLVRTYLHAYLLTGEARYRRIVEETIDYVLADLRHPDGGFFSSEDADSEGVEGKFYAWSLEEITDVCGDAAHEVIAAFGVTEAGNFTDPHTGFSANVLHAVDRRAPRTPALTRALEALAERRRHRVRPALDDKVLTGWNALFLRALAESAAALERDDWMDAARANGRFLLTALRRADGRLLRSWQADGGARHLAFAEDHAALVEALVTLAEVDDVAWITDARALADALVADFADPDGVGFFTTGRDAEALIVRPKELMDNAVPAESSLAAEGLLRLAAFVGDDDGVIAEPAHAYLRRMAPTMAQHPNAFGLLLVAYDRAVNPPIEVAIVGEPDMAVALRRAVFGRVLPASIVVTAPSGSTTASLSPLLDGRSAPAGGGMAYVCEGYACRQPTDDPATLRSQLDAALLART